MQPLRMRKFVQPKTVTAQQLERIIADGGTEEGFHWYRVVIPVGQDNYPIPVKGKHVSIASDYKNIKYGPKCDRPNAAKVPLRYHASITTEQGRINTLYVQAEPQTTGSEVSPAVLEVFISELPISEYVFPRPVIDEPIPFIRIRDYVVPSPRANVASIIVLPFVFRTIDISCPIPDQNIAIAFNVTPVYIIEPTTPGVIGRQIVPGGSIQLDYTSPIQLGFFSGLANQYIIFTGLFGALDPQQEDGQHITAPSMVVPT